LTGIANFSEISKDPLAIPPHGLAIEQASLKNNETAAATKKTPRAAEL